MIQEIIGNKRKLSLGFDADDTSLHFLPALCEHYNKLYGTYFKKSDFYTYAFEVVWGLDIDEAIRRIDIFVASDEFKEIEPVEGAKEVIAELKKTDDLSVVTARLSQNAHLTEYQFTKHFNDAFQGRYHHGNAFHPDITLRRAKSQICIENNIHALVDDGLNHAVDCNQVGIKVFLRDSPWNQTTDLPPNTVRTFNMYHLYDEIQKFKKEKYNFY